MSGVASLRSGPISASGGGAEIFDQWNPKPSGLTGRSAAIFDPTGIDAGGDSDSEVTKEEMIEMLQALPREDAIPAKATLEDHSS